MFSPFYSGSYSDGYSPYYRPADNAYLRALAEEQTARRQYEAARRAEQDAQARAARARLAREQLAGGYGQPYSSYLDTNDGFDDPYDSYAPAYGYGGLGPREQALLEARRRQEERERMLMEARRRQQEEELERLRRVELERERERERMRLEEERREREFAEHRRRRQSERFTQPDDGFDNFYRMFGMPMPQRYRAEPQEEEINLNRSRQQEQRPQTKPAARARTQPPPTQRTPAPEPRPQAPPQPRTTAATPAEIAAATTIQTFVRTHMPRRRALAAVGAVGTQFAALQAAFASPAHLDYTFDGETVPVPVSLPITSIPENADAEDDEEKVPRLAYTAVNRPVHAYAEELNRLLIALDGVESAGDRVVREHRKQMVRRVEAEAERVERWKREVWRAHARKQGAQVTEDGVGMEDERAENEKAKMEEAMEEMNIDEVPADTSSAIALDSEQADVSPASLPTTMDVDAAPIDENTAPVGTSTPAPAPTRESIPQADPSTSASDTVTVSLDVPPPALQAQDVDVPPAGDPAQHSGVAADVTNVLGASGHSEAAVVEMAHEPTAQPPIEEGRAEDRMGAREARVGEWSEGEAGPGVRDVESTKEDGFVVV